MVSYWVNNGIATYKIAHFKNGVYKATIAITADEKDALIFDEIEHTLYKASSDYNAAMWIMCGIGFITGVILSPSIRRP